MRNRGVLLIALLNLITPIHHLLPIGTWLGAPIPAEAQVAEIGEIPVDVIEATTLRFISGERGQGEFGHQKPSPNPNALAAFGLNDDLRPPDGGWLNAPGKSTAFAEAPDHPSLDQRIGKEFTIEAWLYLRSRPKPNARWVIVSKPGSYSMEI